MTRKHYVMIAQAIADAGLMGESESDGVNVHDYHLGVQQAAESVCNALAQDNPRFDRKRFLMACELRAKA